MDRDIRSYLAVGVVAVAATALVANATVGHRVTHDVQLPTTRVPVALIDLTSELLQDAEDARSLDFATAAQFGGPYLGAVLASDASTNTSDPLGANLESTLQFDGFVIGGNPYLAPGDQLAFHVPQDLPTGCAFPCEPFEFPSGGVAALQDPFVGPSLIAGPLYYDNIALNDLLVQGLGLTGVYNSLIDVEHLGMSLFQSNAILTLAEITAEHDVEADNFQGAVTAIEQAYDGAPVGPDVPAGSAINEGINQTIQTALQDFASPAQAAAQATLGDGGSLLSELVQSLPNGALDDSIGATVAPVLSETATVMASLFS